MVRGDGRFLDDLWWIRRDLLFHRFLFSLLIVVAVRKVMEDDLWDEERRRIWGLLLLVFLWRIKTRVAFRTHLRAWFLTSLEEHLLFHQEFLLVVHLFACPLPFFSFFSRVVPLRPSNKQNENFFFFLSFFFFLNEKEERRAEQEEWRGRRMKR